MNRKHFGDLRDLFKYDLVRHVMKSVPGLAGFTFIPMMTGIPGKPESDTRTKSDLEKAVKTGKAGSQNTFLMRYITHLQSIESDPEYIDVLRHYFKNENIPMEALHPQTFTHKERGPYFKELLKNSRKDPWYCWTRMSGSKRASRTRATCFSAK